MGKKARFLISMFKIGMIGFGGGNALIPIIEKTVVEEQNLVSKTEYDADVMIASITPGALPVEIAGGTGRRLFGRGYLIGGAVAMALPGVILMVALDAAMTSVNGNVLKQINFLTIGIYAFICCLLSDYIVGTAHEKRQESALPACMTVIGLVIAATCGKNIYRLLGRDIQHIITLNTIQVFAVAFAVTAAVEGVRYLLGFGKQQTYTMETGSLNWQTAKKTVGELLSCLAFMVLLSIPALIVSEETVSFMGRAFFSSLISFGGGDAYLTVADGMFVHKGMISEDEFYSVIVPLVNTLPGSILCKTLSGIGYYIGYGSGGSVINGTAVALSGFAVSISASCSVFAVAAGLYEGLQKSRIFRVFHKWIKPIVSGLLVNVMLSLLVQVRRIGSSCGNSFGIFICFVFILTANMILYYIVKLKNEWIILFSVMTAFVLCNAVGV